MNLYSKLVFAGICASAAVLSVACAPTLTTQSDKNIATLMLPPQPKPQAVQHTCDDSRDVSIARMLCFDEWDAWKNGGPLPDTVFLSELEVDGLQNPPQIHKDNGNYIAAGLLGDAEECVIAISDGVSTEDNLLSVVVGYRYDVDSWRVDDVPVLIARLFVEHMRFRCE